MPQAFLAFVGQVGAWIIQGTIAVFGESAALFILDVGAKLAGLQLLGYLSGKLSPTPDLSQDVQGQQVIVRGTVEHQRIIYGEVLVGGTLQYFNSAGTHNQSLFHSIILAGHECEDITEVWLDATRINSGYIDWSGIGANDGGVNSGDFRGTTADQTPVFLEKNLGAAGQNASSQMSYFFADITSAHRGQGFCYLTTRFDYAGSQTQVWSAGPPKEIKALVLGKKVYDPRSDSTQSFGTGPHRLTSSSTWEYSSNPALCWADYLIDSYLGMGIDYSKIDYSYVASAAEYCDNQVNVPGGAQNRFECNGVLTTASTHRDNLNRILSSFNGIQTRANGLWKIRAPYYNTPSLTLNEDDLRGDIELSLDPDDSERYNTVRGYFVDRERLYQAQQFPTVQSSEYLARDGGEEKFEDLNLPMTNDIYMAQRLAFGLLEQGNLQQTIVYPTNYKMLPAEVGGTIAVSNDKMNWVDEPFRVLRFKFMDMEGIDLVLRHEDPNAYAEVATTEYSVLNSQGIYSIAQPGVPAPNSLWQEYYLPNHNYMRWNNPPARLFEEIELWGGKYNDVNSVNLIYRGSASFFDHKIDLPSAQYYWVRAVNYAGEYSGWTPNSFGVGAQGADFEASNDFTFDKSEVLDDFWYNTFGDISWRASIVASQGMNDTRALSLVNSYKSGTTHTEVVRPIVGHQMLSDTLNIRFRYRINSYAGPATQLTNSQGVLVYGVGWQADPPPAAWPPRFPQNTGGWIVHDQLLVPVASLTLTGSWGTFDAAMDMTNAWGSGHKIGNFYLGMWTSTSQSSFLRVFIDNVTMRYS